MITALALAHVACAQGAGPGGTTANPRRDCDSADPVDANSAAEYRSACVVWFDDDGRQQTAIELTRAAGDTIRIDTHSPPFPWARIQLISELDGAQWLVVDYFNTEPSRDGASRFIAVYSLSPPKKLLTARPQHADVKDLDQDGIAELVLYEVLSPTRYDIQVGWPHVYKLHGTIESESLRKYPAVVRTFVEEASQTVTHLRDVCNAITDTSKLSTCEYAGDIGLLEMQMAVAEAVLHSKDVPVPMPGR